MNKNNKIQPSSSLEEPSADLLNNLQEISEAFQKIEEETIEIAELIFDYLININDNDIINGTISPHENKKINNYIKILNRLFQFSRKNHTKHSGFKIINRRTVKELDKKTYTFCMCFDGGVSLDILCDIVNTENQARMPKSSPIKITIKQVYNNTKDKQNAPQIE